MTTKHRISGLPLPARSQLLVHRLTPDAHVPTVSAFRKVLADAPSLQRRSRLLPPPSHFSFVNPLPIPFPYDIEAPVTDEVTDKAASIELWLAAREAIHQRSESESSPLRVYDPHNRDQPRILLGLSPTGLGDCVPHLDVGDAFDLLGTPSLAGSKPSHDADSNPSHDQNASNARDELIDVLSGHSTLMTPPNTDDADAFAPWATRYSGHQFGNWAGQLGDGRAISILVTPHPTQPRTAYELQLKGPGRTPFSRTADGLAVLRSSVREYLCAEAIHALRIPTTRSLALVSLPALAVQRERTETACVLTRLAPSFLRIGSFEAFNRPADMFFFGGGRQQEADWEGLRVLGEWVAGPAVLAIVSGEGTPPKWGRELVLEVARRNASMVAGWQAYGFMHGVINTDNVSVLGLTIDYGPYAFMDVFDSFHICNHSDDGGRYAYKYQPNMIIYALRALLTALAPLIGAESELGHAVPPGWAASATNEQLEAWRAEGMKLKEELERVAQEEAARRYGTLMRKRLGLRREDSTDEAKLVRPLLELLERHRLDFHGTFRTLGAFRPALLDADADANAPLEAFIARLLAHTPEPEKLDYASATAEWVAWLEVYKARVEGAAERSEWAGDVDVDVDVDRAREEAMRGVNPRFVLRQWVLEEVIGKVERDVDSGRRVLAKVLHMACNPFEPWGAEVDPHKEEELSEEEREERRLCGIGEKKMLGFQCSCSS